MNTLGASAVALVARVVRVRRSMRTAPQCMRCDDNGVPKEKEGEKKEMGSGSS